MPGDNGRIRVKKDTEEGSYYTGGDAARGGMGKAGGRGTGRSRHAHFEVEKNTAATARTAAVIIRASEDITAAAPLRNTQSGIDDAADITAEFDPAFAAALQEKGYIADSRHITPADVKDITVLYVWSCGLTWLQNNGLVLANGIKKEVCMIFLNMKRGFERS